MGNEQLAKQIYNKQIKFLYKQTNNKRKPLIAANLLNNDRGIDAYHTLMDSVPCLSDEQRLGQNELFTNERDDGLLAKKLKNYDAIIYLHNANSLKSDHRTNICNLFDICRDFDMPIVCVQIPFDVPLDDDNANDIEVIDIDTMTKQGNTSKVEQIDEHKESMHLLTEIMKIFDLSTRNVLRWESFREDQHRFDRDLIQRLHFRQMYVPKTKWQIRKANAIR